MSAEHLEKICGVERDILEKFLTLVQQGFPQADEANYFLETNTGTAGINIGIANLRDVLSHLASVLIHPEWNREERLEQLGTAKEHVRRAIMDSYMKAVTILSERVFKLFEHYKTEVLPLKANPALSSAPGLISLVARFKKIDSLRTEARRAKAQNNWDSLWDKGVKALITASSELNEIESELEEYLGRASQIRESRKTKVLAWWGIIATIVCTILAYLLVKR